MIALKLGSKAITSPLKIRLACFIVHCTVDPTDTSPARLRCDKSSAAPATPGDAFLMAGDGFPPPLYDADVDEERRDDSESRDDELVLLRW
jgi:hypothetical protein